MHTAAPSASHAALPQAGRCTALALGLAVIYWAIIALTPERVLTGLGRVSALRLKPDYSGVRLIQDDFDRRLYIQYGAWLRYRRVPYLEIKSEYPQVATYLFGLPHLVATHPRAKRLAFSAMALCFWLALVAATSASLAALGKPRAWVLALCLPASLYFAANRFDVMAAAFVSFGMLLLVHTRPCAAMMFLAFAVLTKWYPAVLAPLMLRHWWVRRGRLPWAEAATGAGVLALFMGQTLLWAGVDGLLMPYRIQLAADGNAESFYSLLRTFGLGAAAWKPGFLALQFSAFALPAFARLETRQQLLDAGALAVMIFMCFANFYSPQWLLWVAPLLVLGARARADILVVAAFDLLTYIYFPLAYDLYGDTPVFTGVLVAHAAFRVFVLVRLAGRVEWALPWRRANALEDARGAE